MRLRETPLLLTKFLLASEIRVHMTRGELDYEYRISHPYNSDMIRASVDILGYSC